MSMEHKAFAFRYSDFQRELRPLLEAALVSGDPDSLVAFIESDLGSLRDPYEGELLGEGWQDLLEAKDVHQYGDFALTKYYDPRADIGLGHEWEEVQQALESELGTSAALLGTPLGMQEHYFDPGRMGSYFQSEEDVRRGLAEIEQFGQKLRALVQLLRRPAEEGAGLYVTF